MSHAKNALLLMFLTALLMELGLLLDAWTGVVTMFGVAALFNAFAHWHSAAIALRVYEAAPADPKQQARLTALVEELARKAGIPTPGVFIADTGEPNAFATGRNPAHAIIILTRELLSLLDDDEVAGVIAHELAHIRGRDSLMMTVTATITGAIAMLGMLFLVIGKLVRGGGAIAAAMFGAIALLTAVLVQLAIGREREYAADRQAADLCGTPQGLIRALQLLADASAAATPVFNPLRFASAAMMFSSPLNDDWLSCLLETHPPIERRIARLEAL